MLQFASTTVFLIGAVFFLVWAAIAAVVGWYVYKDAAARDNPNAELWGIAIAVLFFFGLVPGLLGIVIYLLLVREQ